MLLPLLITAAVVVALHDHVVTVGHPGKVTVQNTVLTVLLKTSTLVVVLEASVVPSCHSSLSLISPRASTVNYKFINSSVEVLK